MGLHQQSHFRVSKKPPTVKMQDNISVSNKAFSLGRRWQKSLIFDGCGVKKLAPQGILTYCATRTLPYRLYADECELLVLAAPLTSASFVKKDFFDRLQWDCIRSPIKYVKIHKKYFHFVA